MLGRSERHTAAPAARACLGSPANSFWGRPVHVRLAPRRTAVDAHQRQTGAAGPSGRGSPRRGAKLGSMGHRTFGGSLAGSATVVSEALRWATCSWARALLGADVCTRGFADCGRLCMGRNGSRCRTRGVCRASRSPGLLPGLVPCTRRAGRGWLHGRLRTYICGCCTRRVSRGEDHQGVAAW